MILAILINQILIHDVLFSFLIIGLNKAANFCDETQTFLQQKCKELNF